MALYFNQVIMGGLMNGEPKYLSNEYGRIAIIHLDVKQEWTDKATGAPVQKVETHPISVLNPQIIDFLEKYIKPGDGLFIKGILQSKDYKGADGETRYSSRIAIGKFHGQLDYTGRPKKDAKAEASAPSTERGNRSTAGSISDDDIPY